MAIRNGVAAGGRLSDKHLLRDRDSHRDAGTSARRRAAIYVSAAQLCQAMLLTAIFMAFASSPRLAPRPARHPWSWAGDLLGFAAAAILGMAVVRDRMVIITLVHMTIAGIGMAQPPSLGEGFASSSPRDFAHLFAVASAGIVAVLLSCSLLRLLSHCWWRGRGQRVCLVALLAAGLAVTIAIAGRIGLVEIPRISPIMAAQITVPNFGLLALAAVLVLLLVTAAARRWSEPPAASAAASVFLAPRSSPLLSRAAAGDRAGGGGHLPAGARRACGFLAYDEHLADRDLGMHPRGGWPALSNSRRRVSRWCSCFSPFKACFRGGLKALKLLQAIRQD